MNLADRLIVWRALRGWCVMVALALGCRVASAQTFEVLWGAASGPPEDGETWDTWRDWQGLVDLGSTGVRRHQVVFLYQGDFGLYPYAGLQQVVLTPGWMNQHRARMLASINTNIPDPNYAGLAIIDYEVWGFTWSTTSNEPNPAGGPFDPDFDFKDDWRDYVRQFLPSSIAGMTNEQQEVAFATLYNEAARSFILETLRYAKALRPLAKWGFYAVPYRSYYDAQDPTAAAIYGARQAHELGWLYDEQDAFFPDVYSLYLTEGDAQASLPYRDLVAPYVNYLTYNIEWAMDAAQERPVYPVVWMQYHQNAGPYSGRFVNPINMQYPIRLARQMSARGVVIWDAFGSTLQATQYQAFVDDHLRPFLKPFLDACPADFDSDQAVGFEDFLLFLSAFERGSLSADVTDGSLSPQPDYVVDLNDLLYFLQRYMDGC